MIFDSPFEAASYLRRRLATDDAIEYAARRMSPDVKTERGSVFWGRVYDLLNAGRAVTTGDTKE